MNLKVFRFDPETGVRRYQHFELEASPGLTVLSALFQVQERFDGTLSFRYSCRGAVCGSCAMLINKVPRLACRTQLKSLLAQEPVRLASLTAISGGETWDHPNEIVVEPLPNLPVLKDLVVDMRPFFEKYRAVRPYLRSAVEEHSQTRRSRMDPAVEKELELYTNCILCAACYGACPINVQNPGYLGPAALAKLYRFAIDPRDAEGHGRLRAADNPEGWRGCRFHLNCKTVCPRGVPPNLAIGKSQAILKREAGK
jgi:succinate dehydrogenase / fumarate reductase iron-sulfur subunit